MKEKWRGSELRQCLWEWREKDHQKDGRVSQAGFHDRLDRRDLNTGFLSIQVMFEIFEGKSSLKDCGDKKYSLG